MPTDILTAMELRRAARLAEAQDLRAIFAVTMIMCLFSILLAMKFQGFENAINLIGL